MPKPRVQTEPRSWGGAGAARHSMCALGDTSQNIALDDRAQTDGGGAWPPPLVAALDLILPARFPMFVLWGQDLNLFYNEAYEPMLAGKGDCLGRPVSTIFPEASPRIEAIVDRVFGGAAFYEEDIELPLQQDDELVRSWWSFSYSPIRDSRSQVQGVLGIGCETRRRRSTDLKQGCVEARVYLIQPEPDAPNHLPRSLALAGFKVRTFDDVSHYGRVADDLMPGVTILASRQRYPAMLSAAETLAYIGRHLPWIIAGTFDDPLNAAVQFMKRGAVNVLPYEVDLSSLIAAAHSALPIGACYSNGDGAARQKIADLTWREREVLKGLMMGGTNKTIAQELALSPRTVETYRARLMDRMGVRTLADLLTVAANASIDPS